MRRSLAADFKETFLKAVLAGFFLGNLLGFGTALIVDRVPFLQRGLLPLGNLVSAVPIIAVAPIMVMWFGFGPESKTAVIVFMIFFPMLVNAVAGLNAADRMQLDLMRSYGAGYWQTMWALRLPAALPFIFNALKINSTLALIGGIVAGVLRLRHAGHGFPHQHPEPGDECRRRVGDDRGRGGRRLGVLRHPGAAGAQFHLLASILPQSMNA